MRPPDWPERLAAQIAAAQSRPFAWGKFDCFLWAAQVVRALGGPDLVAGTGAWHDAPSAAAAIRRWGDDIEAGLVVLCAERGLPELPREQAQRGDLVAVHIPDHGPSAAICAGRRALLPALAGGLGQVPMRWATRAWAV